MKTVSPQLRTHFGLDCTTLAVLWKVTRTDGQVYGFTNHDQNIQYSGLTYVANTGLTPSATETKSDMSTDNLEVTAFLDSATITEADIRAGKYDFADIEIRIVNWADLTQGDMKVRKGTIGIVKMMNGVFTAEIRGLTQQLITVIGNTYGPVCRAELGDSKCKVVISNYAQNGSVSSSSDTHTLVPAAGLLMVGSGTPTNPAPSGWFNDGLIAFTSGPNNGLTFDIKTWDGTTLILFLGMPYKPNPGDTFSIEPGCDKLLTGCTKFNNIINRRAEDFIPGMDAILNYPDATS